MGIDVELPTYMIAVLIDVINSIAAGLGGKKLKDADKLTNSFKKDSEQKNKRAKGKSIAEKLRAKIAATAKLKEQDQIVEDQAQAADPAPQVAPTTPAIEQSNDLRKVTELLKDSDLDALRKSSTLGSDPQIEQL